MKALSSFIISLLMYSPLFGQLPTEFFDTWYYVGHEADLGYFFPLEVEPPTNPSITFEEDFSFNGICACNTFSGTYSFDPTTFRINMETMTRTFNTCEYKSHTELADEFIGWFDPFTDEYNIENLSHGLLVLLMQNGFGPWLQDSPFLSNNEVTQNSFTITPNPTVDVLYLNNVLEQIEFKIFSSNGTLLVQDAYTSSGVDVSNLVSGVYFLQIESDTNFQTKKFIKN